MRYSVGIGYRYATITHYCGFARSNIPRAGRHFDLFAGDSLLGCAYNRSITFEADIALPCFNGSNVARCVAGNVNVTANRYIAAAGKQSCVRRT